VNPPQSTVVERADQYGIGKKIIFVTNNASKSRRQYKGVFDKLGIEASTVSIHQLSFSNSVLML
jgi:4-nitrophenyl phosphatase